MEVFLYNSTVCRLCGEENDNGTLLYTREENSQSLSDVINTYLPIKIWDDGELPRTICPGCTIQLEATVEFLNLIINGQKVLRALHQRERAYKQTVLNNGETNVVATENVVYEINVTDGGSVYQDEHPVALQMAGMDRPKRKRGRPPKKPKTPEELAKEAAARQIELAAKNDKRLEDVPGKRRRKTPTRFKEAVQGKELDRIFKEVGVTDGDESDIEVKVEADPEARPVAPSAPEVIGHMETSGELVVVVRGKGRGRPKGRMRPTREECAICGMTFSCVGRYMSHVAQHGPVMYQCGECTSTFTTRLNFKEHQMGTGHSGQNVIPCGKTVEQVVTNTEVQGAVASKTPTEPSQDVGKQLNNVDPLKMLPDLSSKPEDSLASSEFLSMLATDNSENGTAKVDASLNLDNNDKESTLPEKADESASTAGAKTKGGRLQCPQCEKTFSSKQSKSMHIKAVHLGERPYVCKECGCKFAYPRSLALHTIAHRRHRAGGTKRYACDLCGKVLNHPSSVVYHKEAEHAGQRYVCNKCGKSFKHKQLLQRHQLVHSQVRPYACKTCNSSFKTKANLINHQLLHSGVKKFSCEICKHRFAHKTSLTLHMRWHTGSKPYVCNICNKSFSQKGNLSEHERIHTGEKPYQCTLCPRRFTTSSQFRLHSRRHLPDRPYTCPHCPKRFATRGSWSAHQRREAGLRSHQCGVCGRGFSERWPLVKHMRRHTGERPFRCPHCPRTFADCSNLNKHKKHVHKQISLLVNDKGQAAETPLLQVEEKVEAQREVPEGSEADLDDERVIYVTYNVDETEPAFHLIDPEQATSLDDSKVLTTCELYSGSSMLVSQPELSQLEQEQLEPEQLEQLANNQLELPASLELEDDEDEHIAVTDEQGNPLHFTMQDGTRLAITSADGKSLQVVTQDGQTIPVEINGFAEDEEEHESDPKTIVHQLNLQKGVESNVSSPVTHYFTIV